MTKIDFIIMAAGNSRRFGNNKLLYEIQGRPMFAFVLDQTGAAVTMLQPDYSTRVLVVCRSEEILVETEKRGFQAVYSPESEQGASFTVRNGILAAGENSDYYMFLAADQPCLQASSLARLVRHTLATGKGIGSMCWQERPGNPVIFHRKYLPQLLALEGDTGGRKIVKKNLSDCNFCQAGHQMELADADTLESREIIVDYMKKM